MKNQRILDRPFADVTPYGFRLVTFQKDYDFCLRNNASKAGFVEIFDHAKNSNYTGIKVLEGHSVKEIRDFLSKVYWTKEDFMTCTAIKFWTEIDLVKAIERAYNGKS